MDKKYYYIILALVILGVIAATGWFLNNFGGGADKTKSEAIYNEMPALQNISSEIPSPSPSPTTQQAEATIIYADSGFSPGSLTIKAGTIVVFKNESLKNVWPASDLHPTHDEYPIKEGGCGGSAFDACQTLSPGGSWLFKFDIKGAWNYHNHINPSQVGKIIVE